MHNHVKHATIQNMEISILTLSETGHDTCGYSLHATGQATNTKHIAPVSARLTSQQCSVNWLVLGTGSLRLIYVSTENSS
jgi:hypothetical protein